MLPTNVTSTKIVRNAATDEWIVRAYGADGKKIPSADYYTDDKHDAETTAKAMVASAHKSSMEEKITAILLRLEPPVQGKWKAHVEVAVQNILRAIEDSK